MEELREGGQRKFTRRHFHFVQIRFSASAYSIPISTGQLHRNRCFRMMERLLLCRKCLFLQDCLVGWLPMMMGGRKLLPEKYTMLVVPSNAL